MVAQDFTDWRVRMGLTQGGAGVALGIDVSTVQRYEAGRLALTRHVALACAYLELARMVDRWVGPAQG